MYHPRTRRREREFPCHLHLLRGRFKTEAIVKRQTALLAVCMMFLVISIQAQAPQSPQVLARPMLETAEEDSRAMKRAEREYGKLNPKAPPELSRFAFLIGEWSCDAELKRGDGIWESLKATWEGRLILDGYVIADEYRMTTPAGELLVLGINLRSYDAKKKTWNMKWLNALGGTWVDLGTEDLSGVKIDEKGITYNMKEPVASHVFTRAT